MKTKLMFFLLFIFFYNSCSDKGKKKQLSNNELLLEKTRNYYNINNYPKALKLLDSLILKDTSIGESYFMRGYCKTQLWEFSNAVPDYLKAINLNYKKISAYYNIGVNEMTLFNDSIAIVYFKEAQRLDPKKTIITTLIETCEKRMKDKK